MEAKQVSLRRNDFLGLSFPLSVIFIFSYYDRLDPSGLGLILGDCVIDSLRDRSATHTDRKSVV